NGLSVNFRTALFRVLILVEYDHASTVTQNKTITVFVPRTTCRLRVIVTGRQRTRCTETTHTQWGTGFFSTTRNHCVGITVSDDTRSLADVMHTRSTGSCDRDAWATQAKHDGQVTGHHVNNRGRNEEWADLTRATIDQRGMVFLDQT